MVMMECPDTVNTLLHEFFLWEPDITRKDCADDTPVAPTPTVPTDTTNDENTSTQKSGKPVNK